MHVNINDLELILGSVSPQAKTPNAMARVFFCAARSTMYTTIYLHECHHNTRIMAIIVWLSASPPLTSVVARRPPLLSPRSS